MFRSAAPGSSGQRAGYDTLRIARGVAESGRDYALGDVFPHDINFDQIGGVSFRKGCYVGQEVVSRMQHRGTARRRVLIASPDSGLPDGDGPRPILAGEREIGTLGTVAGKDGLAIVRLDRLADAMESGLTVTADGIALTFRLPDGVGYPLVPENRVDG